MTNFDDLDTEGCLAGRITAADQAKASLTVARYAENADELRAMLEMLGLVEQSHRPSCRACKLPFSGTLTEGTVRKHADGLCGPCYMRQVKAARSGVVGDTARCTDCDIPTAKRPRKGEKAYGGRGRCTTCYQRLRRNEKREALGEADTATSCTSCGEPTYGGRRLCAACRDLVPAEPVAAHVDKLRAAGELLEQIAHRSGVPQPVLRGVKSWKRIAAVDAARILALPIPEKAAS